MAGWTDFSQGLSAREYLNYRYETEGDLKLFLPDEDFVREWEGWLSDSGGSDVPCIVNEILSDEMMDLGLVSTPAGKIPVAYARSRASFEKWACALYPNGFASGIPVSVNAFTIKVKHPDLQDHRMILLNRMGYSALSGDDVDVPEEEWLEKSKTIRLAHEICHYFSLRALGRMQNHLLDEIVADCAGQLAAFGHFSASLQKRFFGISGKSVLPGGRFFFYVRKLNEDAVPDVLEETEAALTGLEGYLRQNPEMTLDEHQLRLITKLLTTGICEMRELD